MDVTPRVSKRLKKDIFASKISSDAFGMMAAFNRQAKKEGWSKEEIQKVIRHAEEGTYEELIQTLMRYIE